MLTACSELTEGAITVSEWSAIREQSRGGSKRDAKYVFGLINDAHPAATQFLDDTVMGDDLDDDGVS